MSDRQLAYQVNEGDEVRVDSLVARLLDFSRSRVRGLIEHGGVRLNGLPCADPGAKLRRGDALALTYDPERKYREKPAERPTRGFTIVYVDDALVVVNKDAGILSVPTERAEKNSLVDLLSAHLAKGQQRFKRVAVVHRLDRETSGLLIFGRTPAVAQALIAQFAAHKPERQYAALVAGRLAASHGTVRSYLATDKGLNQRSVPQGQGELAVTHYKVVAYYPGATLITVNLETGRRNQIRVHFAEMGHPVLGDRRYRPEAAAHPAWPYSRLALHAQVLGFRHPVDQRDRRFEADLPREFAAFAAAGPG